MDHLQEDDDQDHGQDHQRDPLRQGLPAAGGAQGENGGNQGDGGQQRQRGAVPDRAGIGQGVQAGGNLLHGEGKDRGKQVREQTGQHDQPCDQYRFENQGQDQRPAFHGGHLTRIIVFR